MKIYLISARIAKFLDKSINGEVGWLDELGLGAGGSHPASYAIFTFPGKNKASINVEKLFIEK